jgi:hypothetical protein
MDIMDMDMGVDVGISFNMGMDMVKDINMYRQIR